MPTWDEEFLDLYKEGFNQVVKNRLDTIHWYHILVDLDDPTTDAATGKQQFEHYMFMFDPGETFDGEALIDNIELWIRGHLKLESGAPVPTYTYTEVEHLPKRRKYDYLRYYMFKQVEAEIMLEYINNLPEEPDEQA